jgi:hypothetical protein
VLEKSQPKEQGRDTKVTVSNLPELHKTSSLMLGSLHHLRVLDFGVIDSMSDYVIVTPSHLG